jgi:2-amino-4-hydroxy-6-hydroxymethyldihydropteridine diphosphokinase
MKNKEMVRIIFGIGSNLGNRHKNIENSIEYLASSFFLENIKLSKFLKNDAMLPNNSPKSWNKEFINIAISGDIDFHKFDAIKILTTIKEIEKKIGRKDRKRWAPREIDIDILMIGEKSIIINDLLTIPHQGLLKRDFFLKTVTEIEPELLKIYLNKTHDQN